MHLFILALPLIITVVVIVILTQFGRAARTIRLSPPNAEVAQKAAGQVQLRNRRALVIWVLVVAAVFAIGLGIPSDLGRIALLAPALGAVAAVFVFVAVPSAEFLESDSVRSAELAPRLPWNFARVWPAYASAAVLAVVIVLLGLMGAPDGRSITHDYGQGASTAGPYPGWYYGLPLLVATIVLAALTDLALRRVARAARPSDPTLRDADDAVRTVAIQLICRIATASTVLGLGAVLAGGGSATMSAAGGLHASIGGVDASIPPFAPLYALGITEVVVGLLALATGVVVAILAIRLAVRRAFEPAA